MNYAALVSVQIQGQRLNEIDKKKKPLQQNQCYSYNFDKKDMGNRTYVWQSCECI